MSKLTLVPGNTCTLKVENKADATAEIILYGAIGESFWDDGSISAKQFSEELKKLPENTKQINLRINSPGGSVFDGMTIYERLKQHKAKIVVYVDGVAASIASVIALAGDEVNIGEGSMFMIHKPWSGVVGTNEDMERMAEVLLKIEDQITGIYVRKTGLSRAEIAKMMTKDTWMTADEALDLGFATKKIEASEQLQVAASMCKKATWFKNQVPDLAAKENKEKITELKNKIKGFLAR